APVELLGVVELVASRHAAGVEMADVGGVRPDGTDDVALHDLHVIDVVEQLHAGRAHGLHHRGAEHGVVALIAGMVHLAVQQLHAHGDAVLLGERRDAAESGRAGGERLGISGPPAGCCCVSAEVAAPRAARAPMRIASRRSTAMKLTRNLATGNLQQATARARITGMPNLASYHPQIGHFVLALLAAGVLLRWIALAGKWPWTSPAAAALLLAGTLTAVAAVQSGTDAHGPVE